MIHKINNLKQKLKSGELVVGPWCVIPSPSVSQIIASSGLDFIIIDMEHGPHDYRTMEDMIRACEIEGCSPVVRVPKNDEAFILRALDIGAHGIIIPHIESPQDAEFAISCSKYFPLGKRGFSPFTRAGGYSLNNVKNHSERQNEFTLVILLLEGIEGINNIDNILRIKDITEKVDVIYIGAYDLSQAIGFPGQVDHPEVRRKLKECIDKIKSSGIAAGGYVAKSGEDFSWMVEMGMQFITVLPDCTVIYHAFETLVQEFSRLKIKRGSTL